MTRADGQPVLAARRIEKLAAVGTSEPASKPAVASNGQVWWRTALGNRWTLSCCVFGLYAVIGLKLVLFQHVVVVDGWSRLAHAYFVFYNHPPKLTAIGFVWPPVMTLVFLPLALIPPLATSLAALPLMSAAFAAGMILVLDRTLELCGVRRRLRYVLLMVYGCNPMILFYATNGMGEIVCLFFLSVAAYALIAWYLGGKTVHLALLSGALALGSMTRYELIFWTGLSGAAVVAVLIQRRASRDEIVGTLIAFSLPIVYVEVVWLQLNWSIMHDPLYWFHRQTSADAGVAVNTGSHPVPQSVLGEVLSLNYQLYLPTLVVIALLIARLVARRDLLAGALGGFLLLGPAFTAAMFYVSNNAQYFELRYNMKSMAIALPGVAWLYYVTASRRSRKAILVISAAVLLGSVPLTARTMLTSKGGFMDDAFLRGLASTHDMTGGFGTVLGERRRIGVDEERDMANYIRAHVRKQDSILTDDRASFGVMLLDGRPGVYWDRIDKGDGPWMETLNRPWGRVDYVLVSPGNSAKAADLVLERYPELGGENAPGFSRVHVNAGYELFRVSASIPSTSSTG